MKCPNCHKQIPNESRFCMHCGHKIESRKYIVCTNPICLYKFNPLDALYCTECGLKLQSNNFASRGNQHVGQSTQKRDSYNKEKQINNSFSLFYMNGKVGLKNHKGLVILPCMYHEIIVLRDNTALIRDTDLSPYREYRIPPIYY